MQAVSERLIGPIPVAPGVTPDLRPLAAALPILLLVLIAVIVFSLWGNLTVNLLSLRRETVVGSAFARAARRILPFLGATLLLMLGAIVVLLPIMAVAGYAIVGRHFGVTALVFLIAMVIAIFFAIRLMLMAPVVAAEPVGPIDVIRRSWQLTAGHFWKLLGFFVLMLIVLLVLMMVVGSVVGILVALIAGPPQPGSLGSFLVQFVTGILQTIWTTYFIVMVARIYVQLAGDAGSVAEVFQ
jgi:membrane-anchored glycerophosphoryl diester phosphodiesterase (GDPDase)